MTAEDLTIPVLPWSCDAEQSLLGGLLLEARALDRVHGLAVADFYNPEHGEIYAAVQSLVALRKPVDVVTVYEALEARGKAADCGGMSYLNELAQSVPSASNVPRYAEIVRGYAAQRALLAAAGDALDVARAKGIEVPAKLERIAALFAPLHRQQVRQMPRRISEIAAERIDHYNALADGTALAGWRTGIPSIDNALNGGLRPGGFYVLAARPAVGKSSFSQQIALTLAADGLPALVLSQEMPSGEVVDRAVAHAGRVGFSGLQTGKMDHDEWGRVTDAIEHLSGLPLYVDDQGSLTLADIKAKARAIPGLKLLVLDYLQLSAASDSTSDANRNAQIEEISRGLKALAKELGAAVVALSQLNRQVEQRASKRPTLGDLRDSGAIEQDADVVVFLWPARDLGEFNKLVGCGIDKNRQGRLTEFGLDFHGSTQRWVESTEPLQQQAQGKSNGRGFD